MEVTALVIAGLAAAAIVSAIYSILSRRDAARSATAADRSATAAEAAEAGRGLMSPGPPRRRYSREHRNARRRAVPMIDLHLTAENLSALITSVPDGELGRPTPCSEYTVGDLLDHIAGSTIAFGGAAAKADGPSATMGPQSDASNLDPDWRTTLPLRVKTLAEAWRDPEAWEGMTRVGGGELPGAVAGIITFGELTVHGWDLSKATGLLFEPDPAGLDALFELASQRLGSGNEGARGTAFGPAVPVPEDAPVPDRVLGMLGRDPAWSPA